MALRIGEIEVQQMYLGGVEVTKMFLAEEDLLPPVISKLLQEDGAQLLTEAAYSILLEQI